MEEGRVWSALGYNASIAPNPLSQSGVPTALKLQPNGSAEVRHVIGGLPLPSGWTEIAAVEVEGDALKVSDASGGNSKIPFDPSFLP